MASIVVRLYAENPKDGTTSFNQTRFYQATSAAGAGEALISGSPTSIDLTTKNLIDPGFTSYLHTTGDNTLYTAAAWYNTTTTVQTRVSDWVLQGQDRWDTMFQNEMKDTAAAVWSATDREIIKQKALEMLFPDFFYETIDTSLTLDNDTTPTKTYRLPFGIFNVTEVGIGSPDSTTQPHKIVHPDNWSIEQDRLYIHNLSGLGDTYPIRLVASKKYLEVGEVSRRLDPLASLHLRISAYQFLVVDYPRFLTWGRLQKGSKVTLENLRLFLKQLNDEFNKEKARVKDMWPSQRM